MCKLLSSEFSRLFKTKLFWAAEIFMAGLAALFVISTYTSNLNHPERMTHAENFLHADGMFIIFVIAVFIGIFVGTEYSDGTVRNKIVSGHSRTAIYFSKLIVCTVFSFIMKITYLAFLLGLGIPAIGSYGGGITPYLIRMGSNFVTLIAITSIILLISMMIQSKSTGSVTAVILTLVFLCFATYVNSRLDQPEYYDEYSYRDESGVIQTVPAEINPNYISGTARTVFEFINEAFPYSQIFFVGFEEMEKVTLYPLYSLAVILLTTGGGIIVFRKKNLQ